jgi:hypothetical protein
MTAKRPKFLAERKQTLKPMPQLKIGLFAAAVGERAIKEAQALTDDVLAEAYPKVEPALEVLWDRLAANNLAYDAEIRARHKDVTDYVPRDEDADPLPLAWDDAMSALSYAFMVLYKPEKAFEFASNGAGEATHMMASYYKDADAMEEEEAKWQDRALALVQGKDAARAEFASLPDFARGDVEEPD